MTAKNELDVSVEEVTHAVAEITKMDVVIAGLTEKYDKVIFPVDTPKGLKAAREARKEIREPRFLIEKLRKDGKRPILALGKQLDGRAKEMTERLLAIEGPIDDTIKEEETRADRERQAKIEAEQRRVEAIQARIQEIRDAAEPIAWDTPAKDIGIVIARVERIEVSGITFEEFLDQACDAKDATLARLSEMHAAATAREADEARRKEEQAELERLRAGEERRRAIREKIDEIRGAIASVTCFGDPSSEKVADFIGDVEQIEIDASFEEFTEEAHAAKESTLAKLRDMHTGAVEREQEEAQRQADLERREAEVKAEQERQDEERQREARRQSVLNEISIIQSLPATGYQFTAAEFSRLLARAEAFVIPETDDAELKERAMAAKSEAVGAIKAMLKARQEYEAEKAEIARQQQERDRQLKADEDRKAKAEAAAKKARYPGDEALEVGITDRYEVTREVARKWLRQYGKKRAAA